MAYKIGILGAESCGKTTLATDLAAHLNGQVVLEFARQYGEQIQRPYTFEDVETIARQQIEQLNAAYEADFVFFDTELIITKVWFMHRWGRCPAFLETALQHEPLDFCLLCAPDLPFVPDPLRQNPHLRAHLFQWYQRELALYHLPYAIVEGTGEQRLQNALQALLPHCPVR